MLKTELYLLHHTETVLYTGSRNVSDVFKILRFPVVCNSKSTNTSISTRTDLRDNPVLFVIGVLCKLETYRAQYYDRSRRHSLHRKVTTGGSTAVSTATELRARGSIADRCKTLVYCRSV